MPRMNGYQATAAIRAAQGEGHRTPIIAMTAGARSEDRERCLAAGMDGYLSKPVSKPVLLAKVAWFLKPEGPRPTPPARLDPASVERTGAGAVDAAVIAELRSLGADVGPDFLADLVRQFVRDTDTRLDQLHRALQAGDVASAGTITHGLKGSSATVGGRRLAQSCASLERAVLDGTVAGRGYLRQVVGDYEELRRALARELLTPG